jgi:hypothetical protein
MDGQFQLPQSYVAQVQPGARPMPNPAVEQEIAQIYADKATAARKQLEDQAAAIEEQRVLRLAEFDKDMSKNLRPELLKYPEVQHNIRRDRAMIEAESMRQGGLLRASMMQAGQAERYMKTLEETIKDRLGDQLQPWEATKQYATSEKNWEDVKAKRNPIEQLNTQVREAQDLYNQGADFEIKGMKREADARYQQAASFMKTNLLKTLNSVISSDAVNLSEVLVRYKDLFAANEIAALQKDPLFGARTVVDKYMSMPLDERMSTFKERLEKVFQADPGTFLMNATKAANGFTSTHNKQITDLVENTTSKRTAKRWGAVQLPMMDESVAGKLYKQRAMNELNTPISGGGMQPSQQIQVAPQMQPAPAPQQAAPAFDIDSIRNRLKSGYR